MSLLKYFRRKQETTASIAKERLQIIIAHERPKRNSDYLGKLQQEIVSVIAKYIKIDKEKIKVQLDHVGNNEILELSITMPENTLAETEP